MKRIIILGFALFAAFNVAQAQKETDVEITIEKQKKRDKFWLRLKPDYSTKAKPADDIKTIGGGENHIGAFIAFDFKTSTFLNEQILMSGMRLGIISNRSFAIGVEGFGVLPTTQYDQIDPAQNVVLTGGYGGLFVEPILFSNQAIHFSFPVSAGAGWLGYLDSTDLWDHNYDYNSNGPIDQDVFLYVEPRAQVEINVSKNLRFDFGVSKRFVSDLDLQNTKANAFNKPNYYFGLKLGRF